MYVYSKVDGHVFVCVCVATLMDAEDFESGFQDLESGISTLPQGKGCQERGTWLVKGGVIDMYVCLKTIN